MAVFSIGDKVEVLDDTIVGIVVKISETEVTFESEDGFELTYLKSELVKANSENELQIDNHDLKKAKAEKDRPKKRKPSPASKKDRNVSKMEVDLHINQLVKSSKGMSNHEMLNLQLETAKRQLEFAIRKRVQKVVFIHGVGEGVLKEELYTLFRRYDNVKYYDAEYRKYGSGATEVYVFQNP